jgi:hypothetical protein
VCAEASTVLRAVAADFFFGIWRSLRTQYAFEMGSGDMSHIPRFIKICPAIQYSIEEKQTHSMLSL